MLGDYLPRHVGRDGRACLCSAPECIGQDWQSALIILDLKPPMAIHNIENYLSSAGGLDYSRVYYPCHLRSLLSGVLSL